MGIFTTQVKLLNLKKSVSTFHNAFVQKTQGQPGPASTVEKHRTSKREDPGSTPNEGSKFLGMKQKKIAHIKYNAQRLKTRRE